MKVYLAGPMSGISQNNFPAFEKAAAVLRDQGFEVVSPAEMDDATDYAIAMSDGKPQKTWGDFLARDVKMIADGGIRGIVFLPDWEISRGAQLEAVVGLLQKNFFFFEYKEGVIKTIDRLRVIATVFARI